MKARKASSSFHPNTNEAINYSVYVLLKCGKTFEAKKSEKITVIRKNKVHHIKPKGERETQSIPKKKHTKTREKVN